MFGVNDVDLHVAIDVVYAYRRGRYFSWWKWIQRLIHKIYIHKYTIHVGYNRYLQKLITKHAPSQTEHARENTVTANAFTLREMLVYFASNPNNHCWDVRNPLSSWDTKLLATKKWLPFILNLSHRTWQELSNDGYNQKLCVVQSFLSQRKSFNK